MLRWKAFPAASPKRSQRHQRFRALPENSGIEALLADDSDDLTLVAEGGAADGASRGWRQQGADWQALRIERSDGFEPTDMAEAGEGRLALLERRYTEKDGPAARISLLLSNPAGDGPKRPIRSPYYDCR